ncbi:hypothetical protein BJX96DRAFT_147589 [Aspergillus floccosus]
MAIGDAPMPENLYHVILTTSHISKDPNNVIEKVRIPGTYVSLLAAKAAAHTCLYDAGYERDFFAEYETKREVFEAESLPERQGLAVYAVAQDGTQFRVRIDTTPNERQLQSDCDDGRVSAPLYYVIETIVEYGSGPAATSEVRDLNVQGTFKTYREARQYAETVLLSKEDKVDKDSYAAYDEAAADATDCGYGENVVVHATGQYGENYLISVIQTQELKGVALAEAAMRIG